MNRITAHPLAFLLLLTVAFSCNEQVQLPVTPPPPDEPAPNLATCRIARTVYKNPTIGLKPDEIIDPETVKLPDGSTIRVSTLRTTSYQYDEQGRIREIYVKRLKGSYSRYVYEYKNGGVYTFERHASADLDPLIVQTDSVQTNEQGLIIRPRGFGSVSFFYNQDGQLLNNYPSYLPYTHQYVDGNLTEELLFASRWQRDGQWQGYDRQYLRYRYDLNRPNLPVIHQFLGKPSRNLPLEETQEIQNGSQYPNGLAYRKQFAYSYDRWGRVRRRIIQGKALVNWWLLEDDTYGVGVTDFEYACSPN
ncbi:hypothetical protein [Spirosoma montaniterrae]|uniref:Sugar-binding protein n=1 Tax=Spirosoma montaniterrae TaxID=1178516 RepID=A0A1P9WSW0_9BACT|nr:hypothetical protein [Spirosoma montaniterrae]AQG78471.1 hypothetical protein AWR27_03425 [Spirosoma montaniterrae]